MLAIAHARPVHDHIPADHALVRDFTSRLAGLAVGPVLAGPAQVAGIAAVWAGLAAALAAAGWQGI